MIRATAAAFEQVARENVRDEYRSDVSEIKAMLRDIQRDMQRKADRETIGPGSFGDDHLGRYPSRTTACGTIAAMKCAT